MAQSKSQGQLGLRGGNELFGDTGRGGESWPFQQPVYHIGHQEHGSDSNPDSQTTCWVILGKLLSSSESSFPHLKSSQNNSFSPKSFLTIQKNHAGHGAWDPVGAGKWGSLPLFEKTGAFVDSVGGGGFHYFQLCRKGVGAQQGGCSTPSPACPSSCPLWSLPAENSKHSGSEG